MKRLLARLLSIEPALLDPTKSAKHFFFSFSLSSAFYRNMCLYVLMCVFEEEGISTLDKLLSMWMILYVRLMFHPTEERMTSPLNEAVALTVT